MPLSLALAGLAGLVAVAVIAGLIWRALDGRRRRTHDASVSPEELGSHAGRTVLLQFTTETCARCPQVRRMLRAVSDALTGVEFAEVDLTRRPDLAAKHRILATPTTFVISPDGAVAARFGGVPRRMDIEAALASLRSPQEIR